MVPVAGRDRRVRRAGERETLRLALVFGIGVLGPLVAGFDDHFGFRAAFALFAAIPLIPMAVLANRRFELPARAPNRQGGTAGLALLRHGRCAACSR
jgi:predicted MFS family arabinose efflux permease